MMNNKIKFLLMAFICISISNLLSQKIDGVYARDDFKNIKLSFSNNSFLFKDVAKYQHLPPFYCKDTLAFGYWKLDESGNFLKLFSFPLQNASIVNIEAKEEEGNSIDSLYIYIKNPIEVNYFKFNGKNQDGKLVYYKINLETNNPQLDYSINTIKYKTNHLAFRVPAGLNIKAIEIGIYPSDNSLGWRDKMPPYHVTTLPYQPSNPRANIFKINIPELSECYLSVLRLNGDFVKILNQHQLEWDGHVYSKE